MSEPEAKPLILLVDDDPVLRRLARTMLEHEGFAVCEAENGNQALIQFQEFYPDLVMLDVLMPGPNGIETCKRLRQLPGGEFTPIWMVTALDDPKSVEASFKAGAIDFITKPIQWMELRHRIRRLLESKQMQEKVHFQASLLDQIGNSVVILDKDQHITYWNHASESLFHQSAQAVLGKPFADVLTLRSPDRLAVELCDSLHGVFVAETPAGQQVPVQTEVSLTKDYRNALKGFVAIFSDNSEQQRAANEIQQSKDLYRALVNNIPNGMAALFDANLRFVIAGGTGLSIVQLHGERIEGKTVQEVFQGPYAVQLEGLCHKAFAGEKSVLEAPFRGRTFQLHVLPAIVEMGKTQIGMMIAQDITDIKQAAQVLNVHRQELEELVKQRTSELVEVNHSLQQEINERRRIEVALEYRIEFEKLITNISAYFINIGSSRVDEGIRMALEAIGNFAKVDRSYVFLFSDDGLRMDNTYEWCATGIEPHWELLQDIPIMIFPWLVEKLKHLENVYIPRVSDLTFEAMVERKFFEARRCQSVIAVPLTYNGQIAGFLGFDSVHSEKTWADDLISLLKIAGEMFINAIEHKRAETALRQNEQHLRQITDTMLDTVYQTDVNGIIRFASPSCWSVIGTQPDALIGQSVYAHVHPEDVEGMKNAVQTLGISEYRYRKASGEYVWLETLSNLIFDDNGNMEGMVFASRDITSRKHAEHELQELNRLKTEFLSTAAHELRTPLTSIRGFSEILLTRQLPPERQAKFLKLINEQSTQLGRLIDDLLDISRLEAKRNLTLSLERIDLNALLREQVAPFVETDNRHSFKVEELNPCPPILADPTRMAQVFKNLISNALKYSPNGGEITIRVIAYAMELEVGVHDQGIGMTPEQQAHLFEKFYRADASNTAVGGTGLGLAISKLIVELHGGRIWAESTPGAGSTFHVALPLSIGELIHEEDTRR